MVALADLSKGTHIVLRCMRCGPLGLLLQLWFYICSQFLKRKYSFIKVQGSEIWMFQLWRYRDRQKEKEKKTSGKWINWNPVQSIFYFKFLLVRFPVSYFRREGVQCKFLLYSHSSVSIIVYIAYSLYVYINHNRGTTPLGHVGNIMFQLCMHFW